MSVIATTNLTKVYGKKEAVFTALSNIDLNIQEGESIAIVGKSGSGKSTLMHVLALLDKPSSGTLEAYGEDTQRLRNSWISCGIKRSVSCFSNSS